MSHAIPDQTGGIRFGVRLVAWGVATFALLRTPVIETYLLLPLTRLQGTVAAWHAGTPAAPVEVTLACSGADVMALCLALSLAYPAPWRLRLLGAAGGMMTLLALNTIRIGMLGHAAGTPAFVPLHVHVWPAVLMVATLAYAGAWMWSVGASDRGRRLLDSPSRRFAPVAMLSVGAFLALASWPLQSGAAQSVCVWIAQAAAALLRFGDIDASASGSSLAVAGRLFAVTPECIVTPLMAVYWAGALTLPRSWAARAAALIAFAPAFAVLATVRLLTLALPPALAGPPGVLAHAFNQLLLAGVVVVGAACWRGRFSLTSRTATVSALALGVGLALGLIGGDAHLRLVTGAVTMLQPLAVHGRAALDPLADPQGALAMLPAFQTGLLAGIWVATFRASRWRRLLVGMLLLWISQVTLIVGLGELTTHLGGVLPIVFVRGWAVAGPILIAWLMMEAGRGSGESQRGWAANQTLVAHSPEPARPEGPPGPGGQTRHKGTSGVDHG